MTHSLINHAKLAQQQAQSYGYPLKSSNDKLTVANATITTSITEISLIHQQLQQQVMQDSLIYKRMHKAHQMRHGQETDMKQRETYVGCDTKGFVHFVEGNVLCSTNRIKYSMMSDIGHGTYSRVFQCKRMDDNKEYAIKVIRNLETYRMAAMHEIDILKHIKVNDVDDTSCCIHILDAGLYHGHPMFVFPLLSNSLRSSITPHNPFTHQQIIKLMWQMCHAIDFIHSLRIINTDLKPNNIMFVNEDSEWTDLKIKIIDFGAAVCDKRKDQKHHHMIQTREYRAPEVICGLEWSFEVDMWSLGCILGELVCCKLLFPSHSNANHLHQIIECIGTPPTHLCGVIEDDVDFDNLNSKSNNLRSHFGLTNNQESRSEQYSNSNLYDLCTRMLCWDAKKRITAKQALQHPVFREYESIITSAHV
eukprot:263938_1